MPNRFVKDPAAELDYKFYWANWLASGETIASYVLTVPTGLTEVTVSNDDDSVTVWLSGGTAGTKYEVGCKIITDSVPARTDERTMTFDVIQR